MLNMMNQSITQLSSMNEKLNKIEEDKNRRGMAGISDDDAMHFGFGHFGRRFR